MILKRLFPSRGETRAPAPVLDGVRVDVDELIRLRLKAPALIGGGRRAISATAGIHASRFRGRGIDFQESRNYQPGDDIRNMDWRVTARTGRPHTKLYQEERERPVILLIDAGPSLFFGTRQAFKSVVAARAAALIGWAAVAAGDRVGASFFGAGPHRELRPLGGRRGVLGLIRALNDRLQPDDRPEPLPGDTLGAALGRVRRVARPGSLIVILSDFYSLDETTEEALARLRPHHDLLALQPVDALELAPPPPGRYGISDGEDSGILDTRSPTGRQAFEGFLAEHHRRVRELTRRQQVPLIYLPTFEDPVERLAQGLERAFGRPR